MPPKVRELIEMLESARFVNKGGKGSHRNYKHPPISLNRLPCLENWAKMQNITSLKQLNVQWRIQKNANS
jgi:hypothetical protein